MKKILLLVVFFFNFTYNNITYAYNVSVGGLTYSVSRIEGTYSDNISLLQSQIWWGNTSLAHTFAQATGGNFGYQYFPGSPSNFSLLFMTSRYIDTSPMCVVFFMCSDQNSGVVMENPSVYSPANSIAVNMFDSTLYFAIASLAGPSAINTQSSMQYQASQLRSAFNTQTVAANFALNYDCTLFDAKGMCISAGGRYTTIDNPNINNSAAVVTLGYKVNPNIRIGAYLDQNMNISKPTGIDIGNNTPLMGLYAVWNKEQSGLGYQVRLANTYQDKDVTSTRTVFDTSEAGRGKSSLQSQSYLAELSYAFQYQDKTLVRPYAGLRYTHLKQKGYTEATSTTVTDPLTVAALTDKSATALLGVKVQRSLTDKATLTAQLGLEQDVHHKVDNYSATDLNGSDLTAIAFNSNIKRTRPVASIGAFYDVSKTQRASATINYQQLPFQSTGSATAYFNYMIGF